MAGGLTGLLKELTGLHAAERQRTAAVLIGRGRVPSDHAAAAKDSSLTTRRCPHPCTAVHAGPAKSSLTCHCSKGLQECGQLLRLERLAHKPLQ